MNRAAMEGRGVIKLHPGFLSEKTYCAQEVARYIGSASGGRVSLCPDDVLIELEMLSEKKTVWCTNLSVSICVNVRTFLSPHHI